MLPLIEILIYLLSIYLMFKGVELFLMAYISESPRRRVSLFIGTAMLAASVVIGLTASVATGLMARSILHNLNQTFPGLR